MLLRRFLPAALAAASALVVLPAPAAALSVTGVQALHELAPGRGLTAAGDEAGAVLGLRPAGRLQMRERAADGTWSPLVPVPFAGGAKGLVAASGGGTVALGWRLDRPRAYEAMLVTVRAPGEEAFGEPERVTPPDAGGVRHLALAVGPDGDVLAAWNTGTRRRHLDLQGGVAFAYRPPGGTFGPARTVYAGGGARAPQVGLGPGGRGIIVWSGRSSTTAVAVDRGRAARRPRRIAVAPHRAATVVSGDGVALPVLTARTRRAEVLYVPRRADGSFARPVRVWRAATRGWPSLVRGARSADGRVALTWAAVGDAAGPGGRPPDPSRGLNGAAARPWAVVLGAGGRPVAPARPVAPDRPGYAFDPQPAFTPGGALLAAWTYADRRRVGVEAVTVDPGPGKTGVAEPAVVLPPVRTTLAAGHGSVRLLPSAAGALLLATLPRLGKGPADPPVDVLLAAELAP